jgi:hypothetical protein
MQPMDSATYESRILNAIALCNRGAALLECGCYAEAVSLLIGAVDQYRNGCELPTDIPVWSIKYDYRKSRRGSKRRRSSVDIFLYTTPMFIPDPTTDIGTTTMLPEAFLYCAVEDMIRLAIVFNFAISKHMMSFEGNCEKTDKRLITSLKLYNWALNLEQELQGDVSPLGAVPCLGIINNCAHIHQTLKNEEKSKAMFQLLLSSLMVLRDQGEVEDQSVLEGFVSATCHLILKVPGAAPAA